MQIEKTFFDLILIYNTKLINSLALHQHKLEKYFSNFAIASHVVFYKNYINFTAEF